MNRAIEELRMGAQVCYETPEPESRQGRRNAIGIQLLDVDGAISQRVRFLLLFLSQWLLKSLRS